MVASLVSTAFVALALRHFRMALSPSSAIDVATIAWRNGV